LVDFNQQSTFNNQQSQRKRDMAIPTFVYVGTYTGPKSKGIYLFRLQTENLDVSQNITLVPLGIAAETPNPSFSDQISGAAVSITLSTATAMSGPDGWYRIDLGCPANGQFGFNTTFLSIKHPGYADFSRIIGRGVSGVLRLDCELQRR
jgi:hypothetical protein